MLSAGIGVLVALIGAALLSRIRPSGQDENSIENVERVFGILMIFTACAMAFAHGSNDVANAVGPLAAVVSTVQSGGVIGTTSVMPWWVLVVGAVGIVFGLSTYGWRVIQTIGRKITELTPSRGFAAELAAASTVVLASATGLPISTTHTLVGAVLGVGLARGVEALHLPTIWAIVSSWVVTLPAGAGLARGRFAAAVRPGRRSAAPRSWRPRLRWRADEHEQLRPLDHGPRDPEPHARRARSSGHRAGTSVG